MTAENVPFKRLTGRYQGRTDQAPCKHDRPGNVSSGAPSRSKKDLIKNRGMHNEIFYSVEE